MKIYVAFWNDGVELVPDKAFMDKNKASAYVQHKNETTEYGWLHQEMEVIE